MADDLEIGLKKLASGMEAHNTCLDIIGRTLEGQERITEVQKLRKGYEDYIRQEKQLRNEMRALQALENKVDLLIQRGKSFEDFDFDAEHESFRQEYCKDLKDFDVYKTKAMKNFHWRTMQVIANGSAPSQMPLSASQDDSSEEEDEDGVGNQRQNRSLWGEAGDFEKIELFPSRKKDDKDPRQVQFNIAQGHFLAMKNKAMQKGLPFDFREIRMVEYIVNKELYKKFNAKKKEFKRQGLPHEEVYAFHGTDSKNIDSILKDNLDPKRAPTNGRVHGQGCYFSEFPDISFSYGNGLLLFRTLPGNEFCGKSMNIPDEYQSKKVICGLGDANNYGDMLIIQNPDQFMPYFVYHFSE